MSPPISQSQMLTPSRPFAMRGQSPAGSSTGDSSSGLGAPFTPRDGSDLGINTGRKDRDGSDADSTLKARGRRSAVSFEDDMPRGRERVKNDAVDEGRRNQRRRNEAKAAIEVCVVVSFVSDVSRADGYLTISSGKLSMATNLSFIMALMTTLYHIMDNV